MNNPFSEAANEFKQKFQAGGTVLPPGGALPGAMTAVPGAQQAQKKKQPGIAGLGGPGMGLVNKFGSFVDNLFGGSGAGAAKPIPGFQEGGVTTTDPPQKEEYDKINAIFQSLQGQYDDPKTDATAKQQIANAMDRLRTRGMQLAQEMKMYDEQQKSGVTGATPINPQQQQGSQGEPGQSIQPEMLGNGSQAPAKKRRIIIEESPQQPQ